MYSKAFNDSKTKNLLILNDFSITNLMYNLLNCDKINLIQNTKSIADIYGDDKSFFCIV